MIKIEILAWNGPIRMKWRTKCVFNFYGDSNDYVEFDPEIDVEYRLVFRFINGSFH